jgi:N-methylhydantoinase B
MTTATKTIDPITFEILSHRLHEVTKEMGTTLERVGGTVNTTQMQDYMAALYTPSGDILSAGDFAGWHVACAGVAVKHIIKTFEGQINPDDIFLLNDPYVAAIHQSDVYIISPIHHTSRLVGWSATFVHVMDIGAMSPGGNSPGATEIVHEGVRIPGIKLIDRGELRQDVFNAITNMTRQPTMVGLDLKCELAANNVAKARVQALCERYGVDLIDSASRQLIRQSEEVLRRRIQEIPDGIWTQCAEIEADKKYRVHLTLRKEKDRFYFDFSGTDDQARVGINLPFHATFGACCEAILTSLGYDIPKNQGTFAVLEVIAPEGCLVNVSYPGPVSLSTTSGGAIAKFLATSVVTRCLATSEKWQIEAMSQTLGGRFARHAGVNQYGNYYVSTLQEARGSGATSYRDGVDSGRGHSSCHNVEWVERNFPILYLFRRQAQDSGGPGKFRGGVGTEVGWVVHEAPEKEIRIIGLGVVGSGNSGQGLFGGFPGAPSILVHYQQTQVKSLLQRHDLPMNVEDWGGVPRAIPYEDYVLSDEDVYYVRTSCGGGYGDPLERECTLVERDIRNGTVSEIMARNVYGLILKEDGSLNLEATEVHRTALMAKRQASVSPERQWAM